MLLGQFQSVGRDLCSRGLVCSNSGNLSVRMGDRLVITRRSSMLGCLEENDLIETGIDKNDRFTPLASSELPVHRAIYRVTSALAIVHAHPPHAVAMSLLETEITPNCNEVSPLIEHVPVLGWNMEVKAGGLADIITEALKKYYIVMVHGHGSFAIGQLLEEAHNYTTLLEASCQVLCLLRSLKVNELRK
ncbi:MAG: aldolase [Dehalococcoidia bacterium]|nr:aldolase [Dehalococcoidia bacterium]